MGRRTEHLQTVILAGGLGTRMGMQTAMRPKALVPIGGRPLIEHVMDVYRRFGHHDFIIGTGHMHEMIHAHFAQASVSQGASDSNASSASLPGPKPRPPAGSSA
jgi:NDP-sugar pyrophosphorylase family protein